MNKHISLNQLKPNQNATVSHVASSSPMKKRFEDLGIVPGTRISCVMKSPLGDPVAYLIRGAVIAIRQKDAESIGVYYGTDI